MHEQMKRLYTAADELRSIRGQSAIARELNESPQTVKNWESRGISKSGMLKAQSVFGCSANWLETGTQPMALVTNTSKDTKKSQPSPATHLLDNNVTSEKFNRNLIPILNSFNISNFREHVNNLVPNYESRSMETFETAVEVNEHTFAMKVSGDSMEPDFVEGSIIVVEPSMKPEPNDYVVAQITENEITFKQLINDSGDWYLKPVNERYPLKPLGKAKIIGVVREVVRKLR